MFANLIEASIAAVNAGSPDTFDLADVAGSPNFNDVFGTSGARLVRYCAIEYTDATRAEIERAQWGIGSVSLSGTMVLTQTTILGAWDAAGSAYDDTNPGELTFTADADTTRVICAPMVMDASPWNLRYSTTDFADLGMPPCNVTPTGGTFPTINLSTGTVYYFPICLGFMHPLSSAVLRIQTPRTSPTSSELGFAVYEVASDGRPGKRLATGNDTASNPVGTAGNYVLAFAGAVFLPPGWYYGAVYAAWSGGSTTPTLQAIQLVGPSMLGSDLGNSSAKIIPYATLATTLTDPATYAGWARQTGVVLPLVCFK